MDKKLIEELITYLKNFDGVEKAVLFGSRARGDNTERSDYDIAIFGSLSPSEQGKIRRYCSDFLRTLHKIDLIFVCDGTPAALVKSIAAEGVKLYGKG